jgi:hypothetical protein
MWFFGNITSIGLNLSTEFSLLGISREGKVKKNAEANQRKKLQNLCVDVCV